MLRGAEGEGVFGTVVGSGRLVPGANTLDLSALPSGACLLRTDGLGGVVRVLKQ
jgi:hypothetical protein